MTPTDPELEAARVARPFYTEWALKKFPNQPYLAKAGFAHSYDDQHMCEFAAAYAAEQSRIENVAHPFDKLPDAHLKHVEHWLTSNQKRPDEVRWSLYPLGMVGRWIERAEAAEARIKELERERKEALDILWRDIDDLRDPKLSLVQVAAKAANAIHRRRHRAEGIRDGVGMQAEDAAEEPSCALVAVGVRGKRECRVQVLRLFIPQKLC